MLCKFRLALEGKTVKEISDSSILEFLKMCLANIFALSDTEDKNSRPLNRGGIADLLSLRTLLANHQESQEPSFWEVMDSFALVAYASLAASRTLLQQLIACLNFTLDSKDLFCWWKPKKWFLWAMEMSEVWLDTYDEVYMHQFQSEATHKIH